MIKVQTEDNLKTFTFSSPPMTSNSQAKNYVAHEAVQFVLENFSSTMEMDDDNGDDQYHDDNDRNPDDEDSDEDTPGPDDNDEKPSEKKIQRIETKTTESQNVIEDENMATYPPYTATLTSEASEKAKNTKANPQQKEKPKQRGTKDHNRYSHDHWKGWSKHEKVPGENPTCQENGQPPPIPTSWAETTTRADSKLQVDKVESGIYIIPKPPKKPGGNTRWEGPPRIPLTIALLISILLVLRKITTRNRPAASAERPTEEPKSGLQESNQDMSKEGLLSSRGIQHQQSHRGD